MRPEPGPSQRRITIGTTKEVIVPREGVEVTEGNVDIVAGTAKMTVAATTFKWTLEGDDAISKALRPHVAHMIRGLPTHHFLSIEAECDVYDDLKAVAITVIVPEAQ